MDIYNLNGECYKISFFDDQIEEIYTVSPDTMLKLKNVNFANILPLSDILFDQNILINTKEKIKANRDNSNIKILESKLKTGSVCPSAIWGMPYFMDAMATIFDYFDDNVEVIFDEPKVVSDKIIILIKEFNGRINNLKKVGEIFEEHKSSLISENELKRLLLLKRKISFSSLNLSNPMFEPSTIIEPKTRAVSKYYIDPKSIVADLKTFSINGFKIILCCGSILSAKNIQNSLLEMDIMSTYSEDGNAEQNLLVTPLEIDKGVIYPASKICLIGVSECVGKNHKNTVTQQKTHFIAPKSG